MIEEITPTQVVTADKSTQVAKQGEQQKESQVADQKAAKADQDKANIQSQMADAKAAVDKLNKEIAKIPQKIEEALDDAIAAMEKALGYEPIIKKVKIKKPDGIEIEVPDFDPDKILKDITKLVEPVIGALSPVESVAGKIPVIGDIISLLTKFGTQELPGESSISMKDIRALVPSPPDFPPSLMQKAKRLLQLVQQFLMTLPIVLINVIFQMLCAIYDMFDQIVGVIGVPPPIFPLNLVKQLPPLMPKILKLVQQLPTQVDTLVVEKLKKKYQVAMALQIPKPSLDVNISASAAKNAASGAVSNATAGANDVAESPVAPSTPAPAASNIEETPSIKPIEPKPPVAPPPVMVKTVNLKLEFSGCDPAHTKWWNPGVISKKTIKKELDEVYDWHVKTNSTWFKRVSPYQYQRTFNDARKVDDAIHYTLCELRLDAPAGSCQWVHSRAYRVDSSGKTSPDGDIYHLTRTIELQQNVKDDVLDLTCILKQNVRREITLADGTTYEDNDAATPNGWLDDYE